MTLWYLANQNSFREISDKFNITRSSAYRLVMGVLQDICKMGEQCIVWYTEAEKADTAELFFGDTGIRNVIGAIDGCHIRISRPARRGDDYMNRKSYYSVLLQGICDHNGIFCDVYVGPPGRVHDARMLRISPVYADKATKFGNTWKLLGDSAYISADFPFIITPKRDNGLLTAEDIGNNTAISRGRVIIENVFGRLKCRFRRLRDIQNANICNVVTITLAACILHNVTAGNCVCSEHANGCPRGDDANC